VTESGILPAGERGGRGSLLSIQVARGLAAIAVVAFHARATEGKYFAGVDVLPTFFDHGSAGVDLFFVISGFVMVLTTGRLHGRPRNSGKFLWNRFFRIYPTYWVYCIVLLPVLIFMPAFINSSEGGKVDIVRSFLLLPAETLPLLLVAWTLTLEVWFYLVFAVILLLPKKWLAPALGLWLLALVAVNWNGAVVGNPFAEVPLNSLAIEFVLGGFAALVFRRVSRPVSAILAVAGVAVLVFLGTETPVDIYAGPGLPRPLSLGLGFALLLLAATAFEHRGGIGVVGRLKVLGDMSYSVYLCHVLVLAVMGRIWVALSARIGTSVPLVILWWVVTLVAILAVGYLSYRLIERPVMRLSRSWRDRVFAPRDRASSLV